MAGEIAGHDRLCDTARPRLSIVKLIFQTYLPFQGRFPRVSGQAKMLLDAGHEVTILACDRDGTHPSREVIDGVPVERIRVPSGEMRGPLRQVAPILVFYTRAFRWLRRRSFDLVHCHNLDVLPLGYLVRRTSNVRLLFDAHEPNYYALWPKRLRFMVRVMERIDLFFSKRADAVSVTNDYQVEKYRRAGVRRVELIGNYPPPELRDEGARERTPRPYAFGRLGTFYPEVGLEETMEAFGRAVRRHPQARFLLAGRVVDSYRPRFERAIEPLRGNVEWTGPYPAGQMSELYARIRVSCLIYPKTDWFRNITPRKFFDSVANGVPVLMTDIGGLGAVIREHRCGLVVDEKDIAQISEAMEMLLTDERLVDELAANTLALARREYGWEAVSRRYVSLNEELHAL
jgi:glycosyltransferase involved in cell wall biosynthesis